MSHNDLYKESKRYKKINKAQNSYVKTKIDSKIVINCKPVKNTFNKNISSHTDGFHTRKVVTNKFKIDNNTFVGIVPQNYTKSTIRKHSDFYASIYIIELYGLRYVIILNVYISKQKAFERIDNNHKEFEFKFHNSEQIRYVLYRNNNVMGDTKKQIKSKHNCYYDRNLPIETILSYKANKPDIKYESIKVDVELSISKLSLYSKELNCEWEFYKNKSGLLPSEGIKFLEKANIVNNSYILSVTTKGGEMSNWMSTCGNYWVIEESL